MSVCEYMCRLLQLCIYIYICLCVDKSVGTEGYMCIMFILIIFWPIGGGGGVSRRVLEIGLGNG